MIQLKNAHMDLGFDKPTHDEWLDKIKKDLRGTKTLEEMNYSVENLSFSNFPDVATLSHPQPLVHASSKSCGVCTGATSSTKNALALQFLGLGVEALAFDLSENDDAQLLFKDIYLDMVDVMCFAQDDTDLKKFQSMYINDDKHNIHFINKSAQNQYLLLNEHTSFEERIKAYKNFISPKECESIFVNIPLKSEFLPQIAELRALRRIWNNANKSGKLTIISEIPQISITQSEVHPLIIYNYLIMSARMGMVDYILNPPIDSSGDLARLTLNINHILTEESRFAEVSDPTAGSYMIEQMTEAFVSL